MGTRRAKCILTWTSTRVKEIHGSNGHALVNEASFPIDHNSEVLQDSAGVCSKSVPRMRRHVQLRDPAHTLAYNKKAYAMPAISEMIMLPVAGGRKSAVSMELGMAERSDHCVDL